MAKMIATAVKKVGDGAKAALLHKADIEGQLAAIGKSQGVIEFNLDGTVITANANFLGVLGYTLDEIQGKHHSMLVDLQYRASPEYLQFWERLNRGEFDAGQYKRIGKGGKEVWIQASYNPILDGAGKPFKVVKYATDVTAQRLRAADVEGQLAAIGKSQGIIEFNLDGTVITANANFLGVLGYTLEEIKGKHHSLFVDGAYRASLEYRAFWERLNRGEFDSGQYKRMGKGGKEVWIQASYNPIFDPNGKPFKVVKYATDITAQKIRNADFEGQLAAIGKAQGVIEFNLDGSVITANQNFLAVLGYTLDEIKGRHHSMFVDPQYRASPEYLQFWERLNRGEFDAGQYKRIAKGGKDAWIQASYNPIFDPNGKPFKVVKFATDITAQKNKGADFEGQLAAISKAQAVIEFNLDGTVISANGNFLDVLGYTLEEIKGKHHSMFVDSVYRASPDYRQFWERLNRGEFDAGQYKRIGKGGTEKWIQASYNPIYDPSGKVVKVVKYATDVTAQKHKELELMRVMTEVNDVMASVAEGDLTREMSGEYSAEFQPLQTAINGTVINLRSTVGSIDEATQSITSSSSEIARGNSDLSQRTQEQAASLEETASSIEQLTGTVNQNAENARHANQLASGARQQAERGGEVVSRAILAMQAIDGSSKKISEIIGVIDEIAFQTNLLALNAAVEAARAGEQGRGFAVVASEVRNLAQRSATAAKEIKLLIKDSAEKVQEGSKLVNESGTTLTEIVASSKKVSDIVGEIASASEEQSAGIEQVNKAISQMDSVTQQNAALVEEAAAASASLDDQAQTLGQLMMGFKIAEVLDEPPARAAVRGVAKASPPAPTRPAPTAARGARPASPPARSTQASETNGRAPARAAAPPARTATPPARTAAPPSRSITPPAARPVATVTRTNGAARNGTNGHAAAAAEPADGDWTHF